MFSQFADQRHVAEILQRSLDRGRLAHAYLFSGDTLEPLREMAKQLAKTLNCEQPPKKGTSGLNLESCDRCSSCRRIDQDNHPDIGLVRPESKLRIVKIEQIRDLIQTVSLKPSEAQFKVSVIVGADRLTPQAANAFLKTLEEPPPRSILVLLTTNTERILETIFSRCLRLQFASQTTIRLSPEDETWLGELALIAQGSSKSLLSRYKILSHINARLEAIRNQVENELEARSPMEKYPHAEKDFREKWEDELDAAVAGEYRRRRGELIGVIQWWFRDIWLETSEFEGELHTFPGLKEASVNLARRLNFQEATHNLSVLEGLQRLLHTNVQEALALEVNLLKLKL